MASKARKAYQNRNVVGTREATGFTTFEKSEMFFRLNRDFRDPNSINKKDQR